MNTDGDKRIVFVASSAASQGVWDPNNLQGDSGYARLKFYGNSKLYVVRTCPMFICMVAQVIVVILNLELKQICKPRCYCLVCSRYRW